jgi:hypothetical protein
VIIGYTKRLYNSYLTDILQFRKTLSRQSRNPTGFPKLQIQRNSQALITGMKGIQGITPKIIQFWGLKTKTVSGFLISYPIHPLYPCYIKGFVLGFYCLESA